MSAGSVNTSDEQLLEWGSRVFNTRLVKRPKSRRGLTGVSLRPKSLRDVPQLTAGGVRSKLGSITRKAPEVLVRISGGGKGMHHIGAHLNYVSRNGQIELEDQNGEIIAGKDDLKALKAEWRDGGFPVPDEGTRKEAFNIILSMPAGTSEAAVKEAARQFAADEFSEHQYVFAMHTFDSDPDPTPSPNPHVHLTVKARSDIGVRLNPRKADLHQWREKFAKNLRELGIDAAATNRQHRMIRSRPEKLAVKHMRKRGAPLDQVGRSDVQKHVVDKSIRTEADVLRGYQHIAKALAGSINVSDRRLAGELVTTLAEQRKKNDLTQQRRLRLDGKER